MANPNPSPKTRFKKGRSGNPGGITKERKQLIMEAADYAAQIQHRLLEATVAMMREHPEKEGIRELVDADIRQIMKDVLDRADGTARQSVDLSSKDGSMSPQRIVIEAADGNRDTEAT